MKKKHLAGAMSLLLLAATAQATPSSTELKVGGALSPKGACTVKIGGGGIIDLGKIKVNTVHDNEEVKLPISAIVLHAACEKNTQITYTVTDNKQGTESQAGYANFGFGNVNGSGKLGYYKITAYQGYVDDISTSLFHSMNNNGLVTTSMPMLSVDKENYHGWVSVKDSTRAAIGKDYKLSLAIDPTLGSKKDMKGPLTEDVALDGSATFNLFYSI
ncbi:DUF1120 domain-containing protein [Serratia liquefaciens]|uniref:DUF1120 domain-containing protein n=1 Tax=Serratia liquefaciens TaxID=614 RepID=UPI00380EB169